MTFDDSNAIGRFIRKLDGLAALPDRDKAALKALPLRLKRVPANHMLVREGDMVNECSILLEGFACRHKDTSGGHRQIVSFHLPGDILDLQHLWLSRADHNVETLTAGRIALIATADLRRLAEERPAIDRAFWRDALIDASIFREWVLNVGGRDGKSRIAHMLCEFGARWQAAGLGSPDRFELPMTQQVIAEATGMSLVHVNRMLQELDRSGAIVRDKRVVEIVDWDRMREIADFDPAYLHAAA